MLSLLSGSTPPILRASHLVGMRSHIWTAKCGRARTWWTPIETRRSDRSMDTALGSYLPQDRRQALARGVDLPDHTTGVALFADISSFTPLTEALDRTLGARRGAEEMTRQINRVYDALIAEVDRYSGSVIGFAGDAITCWFDDQGMGDGGWGMENAAPSPIPHPPSTARAVACAVALQDAMQQCAATLLPDGTTTALGLKVAVASGPARRFVVGDPALQLLDVLAGAA